MRLHDHQFLNAMAAGIALLVWSQTPALAKEIECPSSLQVQESADLAALEGWRAYDNSVKGTHHLFDVAFSEGPPDKLVFRTPSKSTATKLKKLDVYDFSSEISEEVWLSCLYRDTALSLAKKMPEKFSRCEVAYDPKTGFRTVKRIDCF
jgi:hypothetical protein